MIALKSQARRGPKKVMEVTYQQAGSRTPKDGTGAITITTKSGRKVRRTR
jgi:hypothetical protein